MSDLIDRQAAIDFINAGHLVNPNEPRWSDNEVVNFLKSRPSAQPSQKNVSNTLKALDCVSRQAAIDALCDNCDNVQAVCAHYPCKQYIAIEKLPSAQTKKGRWVNVNEGKWNTVEVLKCTACGEMDNRMYRTDGYCPNCGAKMKESAEE